jgi:hypothetical protein
MIVIAAVGLGGKGVAAGAHAASDRPATITRIIKALSIIQLRHVIRWIKKRWATFVILSPRSRVLPI